MFKVFFENFLEQKYYLLLIKGLGTTLLVSTLALLIGLCVGVFLVTLQNITFNNRKLQFIEKTFCFFSKLYVDVIRGTPMMLQIIFFWLVIFGSLDLPKSLVGAIAIGLNSGAYVSEMIRSGIKSIDKGQLEGGLSLGLTKIQTFKYVIMPQAIKNMFPTLSGEYVTLIKDTSLLSAIGAIDLTRSGDIIISNTGNAIYPLLMVAFCYLVLTSFFSFVSRKIENNFKKKENNV